MPRRATDESTHTLVYRANVRPTGSAKERRDLLDNPDWMKQLRLAHELRNALVEIEHRHEQSLRALWSTDPRVAAAEEVLAQANETVSALTSQAKREHSEDRSVATRPATAQEIKAARAARRQAATTRKEALAHARRGMKDAEHELESQRRAAIKGTYAEFAQARGLYWATYNQVKDQHLTAARKVLQLRGQGRPAQLRFKRWDATGTIAVQLQRQGQDPQRTPERLASGKGKWHNVLRLGTWMDPTEYQELSCSERRRVARCEIGWQLGNKTMITLPVEFSRMIPADADITNAQLTVTRVGDQRKATVYLTATQPAPPPKEGPLVAIHMGWRLREDGSVRVATWASTSELPPPPGNYPEFVQSVIHRHAGGRGGEIIAPARWLDDVAKAASLRAIRDKELLLIREHVADWLDHHPQPDPTENDPDQMLTGTDVRRWRSPGRLARLAMRWRDTPPTGTNGDALAQQLEEWRKQDKHLWAFEAGVRHNPQHHRTEAYRHVAAWIATHAGAVVTDKTDIARLTQRDDVAHDDPVLPGQVATDVRARARVLSPGELRATIRATAKRSGVADIQVPAEYITRRHHRCGHVADTNPQYAASEMVMCPSCGNIYDQDHNACQLMLAAAREQLTG